MLSQGFYTVYRKVFETIAAEDLEYMDDAGSDTERPEFGDSNSSYEEVVCYSWMAKVQLVTSCLVKLTYFSTVVC